MPKTDAERLERIKLGEYGDEDVDWLVEQAEMTEKFEEYSFGLKSERDHWIGERERMHGWYLASQQEKEKLRLALVEIFELSKHDNHSHYLDKCYVVARQALGAESR